MNRSKFKKNISKNCPLALNQAEQQKIDQWCGEKHKKLMLWWTEGKEEIAISQYNHWMIVKINNKCINIECSDIYRGLWAAVS